MRRFPDASWWMKRDRAEHHLEELETAIGPYVAIREHVVSEREEPKNDPNQRWVYSASVDGVPDPAWAYIAGDILFNLRCSLDHMAVALNPRKYQGDLIYFPILDEDPWAREPGTRRYIQRDPTARRDFRRSTEHMNVTAAAYIKSIQPYHHSTRLHDHVARNLRRFNNADKHRKELVQITGLVPHLVELTDSVGNLIIQPARMMPPHEMQPNGAVILTLPRKVKVKFLGTALIGIGNSVASCYEIPGVLEGMFLWVDKVLSELERTFPP